MKPDVVHGLAGDLAQGRVAHIGIEAGKLLNEKRGIGRYVRNLLVQLPRLRPQLRFTLFTERVSDVAPLRAQLAAIPGNPGSLCEIRTLDELPDCAVDVMWYPWNLIRIASRRAAMVATIHDIAPMLRLDHRWWRINKRIKYRRRFASTIEQATLIMPISTFTARELQQRLKAPASKLRLTLLAADNLSEQNTDLGLDDQKSSVTPESPGVEGPFFLSVGASDDRKNLVTLYRAMDKLYSSGCMVKLVQCGPEVHFRKGNAVPSWLRPAGYVSDEQLAVLYNRAVALVFPSRYEGFGLPVVEAMMAGGCVICADTSSLPEVAGDAALYFHWNDADGLATQMQRLLEDETLRSAMVARGRAQASKFTWRRNAMETLATFDEAFSMNA